MTVVTRFAPSPTGFLHIGGARTALFNWLFARHHGGRMLLRIEDTDRARSNEAAVAAISDGLSWLGLDWDGEAISQFSRFERHAEVARAMVKAGTAYHCYCSPEELADMREAARAEGRPRHYDGRWRDRDPSEAPAGVDPVIRLRTPLEGATRINDLVQGEVTVPNTELDDLILLRSDGTPTYMHAVVVDDHDMGISHVIRGDDHLTNAFRQSLIYQAMNWDLPEFAHIPLIHGADGGKLSKRHGALGVDAYREMGYLPAALRNYLARLGWSHGDDEIFSDAQAVDWFSLEAVGKSPARFDFDKLKSLNAHYIQQADDDDLARLVAPFLRERLERTLTESDLTVLTSALAGLRQRAKTLPELADAGAFYFHTRPLSLDDKAAGQLSEDKRRLLGRLRDQLAQLDDWREEAIETAIRDFVAAADLKFGQVAQPLRASLTGRTVSPGIFEVLRVLGRQESLGRIDDTVLDG